MVDSIVRSCVRSDVTSHVVYLLENSPVHLREVGMDKSHNVWVFSENRFDLSDPRSLQGLPWGSPSHVLGTASPGASSQKGASLWVYHVATLHEGLSALAQSGWWWAKRRILFKAFVLWTVPMNFPQSITEASSNKIDGDRPIRQSGQVLAHRLAKKIIQRMRQSAFCTFQNVIVQRDELHFVWATHSCFPLYSF